MSTSKQGWIKPLSGPCNRVEAYFTGGAFTPHRHDTYAIAMPRHGVQQFDYRGATQNSLPGSVVVLYPDELHDGRAGTEDGFCYRTIYIKPEELQTIYSGESLPFVEGGVSTDEALVDAVSALLDDENDFSCPLQYQDALFDLASALRRASSGASPSRKINSEAVERARQYIQENLGEQLSLAELESVSGYDRWALSRDFRAALGASPYRYLVLRRLEKAQSLVLAGRPIAEAAFAAHFSDQSHFTRHFKKTYGLTPKNWAAQLAA